jgi:hypothetical protein
MIRITNNTIADIITYTKINDTETVSKFDGIVINPIPNSDDNNIKLQFGITLINTKVRIKYPLNEDFVQIENLPLMIKQVAIFKTTYNTNVNLFILESAVHIDFLIKSFIDSGQLKIK